jgi:phage terminase small subunit
MGVLFRGGRESAGGGEYVSDTIRDKAYKDYCNGMKYKAIAEKYQVSLSTVKSWAARHWKAAARDKKLQPKPKKVAAVQPAETLKEKLLESVSDNEELTEKRRLFCLYYATSHNALQSYLKAYQCAKETAMTNGPALLRNTQVRAEVKRLQGALRNELDIGLPDLLQYCLKVVGADLGDYVTFKSHTVRLADSRFVDTSVISEIKRGKDGINIKLEDKKWAWETLAKYLGFDAMEELKKEKLKAEILKAEIQGMQDNNEERVVIVDDVPSSAEE